MPIKCKSIPGLFQDAKDWTKAADGTFQKWAWSAEETCSPIDPHDGIADRLGHMQMALWRIPPGIRTRWHVHPQHVKVVMCWDGNGRVEFTDPSSNIAYTATLTKLDTLAVPKGAPHAIENTDGQHDLLLLVVHALNGVAVQTRAATGPEKGAIPIPSENIKDYRRYLRDKDYYAFNNDPSQRALRKRVWGRVGHYAKDRDGKRAGDPDHVKDQFHMTNYCFELSQENPGHFHPYSIELIVNLEGRPLMIVRDKRVDSGNEVEEGWPAPLPVDKKILEFGDSVLVHVAGWHRYINLQENYEEAPDEDNNRNRSLVLAMQAPHPIMHTLEDETTF